MTYQLIGSVPVTQPTQSKKESRTMRGIGWLIVVGALALLAFSQLRQSRATF